MLCCSYFLGNYFTMSGTKKHEMMNEMLSIMKEDKSLKVSLFETKFWRSVSNCDVQHLSFFAND